jgi:hypothetical protein
MEDDRTGGCTMTGLHAGLAFQGLVRKVGLFAGLPALVLAALPAPTVAVDQVSTTAAFTITIEPVVTSLPDGSVQTTYALPDGDMMTTTTPPPGFDPLTASDAQLREVGFPLPPSDASDYQEWAAAMAAFKSDDPPAGPLQVVVDSAPAGVSMRYFSCPSYCPWGGYTAGTRNTQSHTYVAVKSLLYVPSNTGTTCSNSNTVGMWIGLGGTGGSYPNDNLVQQGIECGNTDVGSGSAYRPFTEFADGQNPVAFCGYTSWTLSAGHKIYQNMSFQTSQNKAFFYLQDETSGVIHSCSRTPYSGWHYDLNTAEWIAEAPTYTAVDFGSVSFSDAMTELNSNGTWVSLGSQPVTKMIDGYGFVGGHLYECIVPGSISSGTAFTDSWVSSQCAPT